MSENFRLAPGAAKELQYMQRLIVRTLFVGFIIAAWCDRPVAAQNLEVVAGAIGGVPSGANAAANIPGSCSTYGSPAPIGAFFGSAESVFVPQGGTAFCGYSGDVNDQTATAGPLAATQS